MRLLRRVNLNLDNGQSSVSGPRIRSTDEPNIYIVCLRVCLSSCYARYNNDNDNELILFVII